MASVQSNVDWQSTKNTILERNRQMFNNSDMSDISFTCEGSDKTFYAHKYVLATSSAVFHAMFYGGLAVKDSILHLSDTNDESLEQFLRFLYTEKCTLTADNVVTTRYLAKKYIIPSLNEKCVNFLLENLNPENVLDILEQMIRFDEKELEKQCWEIIESSTGKVVASDSFNNISQTTLAKLLKRDILKIPEVELFQAVLKWIDFQCSRKNLKPTGENRRPIIGEAIYDFRFIGMSQAEFVQHVSKSGLLTSDELVPIYEKFLGFDSPALKWNLPNRKPGNIVRFSRFSKIAVEEVRETWRYGRTPDRLCFSVNEEAFLLGVRLFGDKGRSKYHVTFEVKEAKVTGTYISERNQDDIPGFDVMLNKPVILKQNEVVTLSATIEGPQSCGSKNGIQSITLQEISVTFSNSPPPHNGTQVNQGQFHKIILEI
ncbi:BTB POZ domain-containing 6-like [Paramuricea clavata]|uniref:BTB POZ domain-containing 6-like n=1 Tax=Paramuricea clavata TaxID=317549 RepID=A0A6S7IN18_PARCT|nr:BTB POZ domain-containing 6-like [Paramuricea clavata]